MRCKRTNLIRWATVLLALVPTGPARALANDLPRQIGQLHELLQSPLRQSDAAARSFVEHWVDVKGLVRQTFGNYLRESLASYKKVLSRDELDQLLSIYEQPLVVAFSQRLIKDLELQLNQPALHGLQLQAMEVEGERGSATVSVMFQGDTQDLIIHLRLRDDRWLIDQFTLDGKDLSHHYRRLYRNIIEELYSLPVLIARLAEKDYIVLDDFSTTSKGEQPRDWGSWRDKDQGKPVVYRVRTDGTNHYLAASDTGSSVILGKFVHWNPREYPIMTWCWRANALPPGGNEFLNHANDSAAGIYVIFSQNWLRVPKQLKYVWSSTLPTGTVGRRNKIFRPWFFVVESGEENLGKWTFEMVDLVEHHKLKLGGKPAKRTIGLGLLTDANSTNSYAEAFYADLRVWKRETFEHKGISNYCGNLNDDAASSDLRSKRLLGSK